jgi:hypothetical protein
MPCGRRTEDERSAPNGSDDSPADFMTNAFPVAVIDHDEIQKTTGLAADFSARVQEAPNFST